MTWTINKLNKSDLISFKPSVMLIEKEKKKQKKKKEKKKKIE